MIQSSVLFSSPDPQPLAPSTLPHTQHPSSLFCQFLFQDLVQQLRVRFALSRFHHLPDKERQQPLPAGAILGDLVWVCRQDLSDLRLQRSGVTYLAKSLFGDEGVWGFAARAHRVEHRLGDLAADRPPANETDQGTE